MAGWRTGILITVLCGLCAPAAAAQLRQLKLVDGSVISGEIVSVHDGTYTVTSPSLGTITVKDSEIRSIDTQGNSPDQADAVLNPPSATSDPRVEAVQRRILGDDALMGVITELEDDPEMHDIVSDPAIMEAVQADDLTALERNPKVQRLMDNPKMQEIRKKLAQ